MFSETITTYICSDLHEYSARVTNGDEREYQEYQYLRQGGNTLLGVDADLDRVREALEANLFGAWRMCEAFIPLMQRHHYGRIVNISSGMGALNDLGGGSPGYRLSKAGLNVLTRILASELLGSGILVNSVCPGWVRTDMGGSGATRSVEEGADTPVWAATLPDNGFTC